jgi:L-seryl-tRNA(Ser) seleniumtransferase
MLTADSDELRRRAERIAEAVGGRVIAAPGRVGGGALPLLELEGPVVALDPDPSRAGGAQALAAALRAGDPAVVGRISDDAVLLDPRTVAADEADALVAAVLAARNA